MRGLIAATLLASTLVLAPHASADQAESRWRCVEDPTGDVVEADSGDPAADSTIDAVRLCHGYEQATYVAVVTTEPPNGAFFYNWGEFFLDTDGDGEWDLLAEVHFGAGSGEMVNTVTDRAGVERCDRLFLNPLFGWELRVPRACVGDTVTVGAVLHYEYTGLPEPQPEQVDAVGGGDEPALAPTDIPDAVVRLEHGGDVVDRAIAWSRLTYRDGDAPVALLTRDDAYADALASASAQRAVGGPLLTTPSDEPDARMLAELDRLGTDHVVVLGGTEAISPEVVDRLEADGMTVERIAGPERASTAVAIADRFTEGYLSLAVRGYPDPQDETRGFADILGTAALVGRGIGGGILLTEPHRLPDATPATVNVQAVVGGRSAVSDDVLTELAARGSRDIERIAGPNRFATAVELAGRFESAEYSVDPVEEGRIILVDGTDPLAWLDGFAAASHSFRHIAATLLVDGDRMPDETAALLSRAGSVTLVCGPSVSAAACDAAAALLA